MIDCMAIVIISLREINKIEFFYQIPVYYGDIKIIIP